MAPKFPPIRACIFDVDGTLIDSEDIYTEIYNRILHAHGKPDYAWTIKAYQQSRGIDVSTHSNTSDFYKETQNVEDPNHLT
jgi:pseudouridine-5'-monophosphatase